jgi:hypothetical protein
MTGGNSSAGVAIVGIACRFPGAVAWEAFEDAGEPVPPGRLGFSQALAGS